MSYRRIPCTFMRGGTSKALVFRRADLPVDPAEWPAIFSRAMGSPDPYGRQLDGMGGGISSLSKVCVVGPSTRADADVDFTFYQIGVTDCSVDDSGNCGNMSSAIGPFALDEGLVPLPEGDEAAVRIHNTNTAKIILARFPVHHGRAAVEGDQALDGVAGTAAPIRLEFLDPGGAKSGRLLPAPGGAVTELDVPGVGRIRASLVDAANPSIFIEASSVGKTGTEPPEDLESDAACMAALEAIRRAGAVAMGMAKDAAAAAAIPSQPKIAMISRPAPVTLLSGESLPAEACDICVRMISMEKPHRAVPLTGALCLAVALRTPGTLAHGISDVPEGRRIRIGHPSGVLDVDASVEVLPDGPKAEYGAVYRTARRLFEGNVLIPGKANQ